MKHLRSRIAQELQSIAQEIQGGRRYRDPDEAYDEWKDNRAEREQEKLDEEAWHAEQEKAMKKPAEHARDLMKDLAHELKQLGMSSQEFDGRPDLSLSLNTDQRWLIEEALEKMGFRKTKGHNYDGNWTFKKGDDEITVQWGSYHRHSDYQEAFIISEKGRKIYNYQEFGW